MITFKLKNGNWNNTQLSKYYEKNGKFMAMKEVKEPKQYQALCLGAVCLANGVSFEDVEEIAKYRDSDEYKVRVKLFGKEEK